MLILLAQDHTLRTTTVKELLSSHGLPLYSHFKAKVKEFKFLHWVPTFRVGGLWPLLSQRGYFFRETGANVARLSWIGRRLLGATAASCWLGHQYCVLPRVLVAWLQLAGLVQARCSNLPWFWSCSRSSKFPSSWLSQSPFCCLHPISLTQPLLCTVSHYRSMEGTEWTRIAFKLAAELRTGVLNFSLPGEGSSLYIYSFHLWSTKEPCLERHLQNECIKLFWNMVGHPNI